ncbi:MAG TPA: acyl-CoA desaturase, partial [Myxococcaceae bacterium]
MTIAANGNPLHRLTAEQIEELGREFQRIHDEVYADLGAQDAHYIRSMIQFQRRLATLGRIELIASRSGPAWLLGTMTLSAAKILENMEIGHNVLHGQWDWMNDPNIHSSTWDWDTASPASAWKHSHNFVHHTYTNIVGKDKDVGYEILRVDPKQRWHPVFLLQPFYNVLLAAFFEWGVAIHDLDFEAIRKGTKPMEQVREELRGIRRKARRQIVKDYVAWPLVSGVVMTAVELAAIAAFGQPARERRGRERKLVRRLRGGSPDSVGVRFTDAGGVLARLIERRSFREPFRRTLTANLTANFVRNLWSYAIIFCGHFPDQAYTFTEEEVQDETLGGWYVRQLIGAANIDGGPFFHVMSGNLSYQVEHHLFPDMPSSRYQQIAPRVRAICERYDLPYNTGPFGKQFGSVQRTLLRLAFPGGAARPKPGPHREPDESETVPQEAPPAFP